MEEEERERTSCTSFASIRFLCPYVPTSSLGIQYSLLWRSFATKSSNCFWSIIWQSYPMSYNLCSHYSSVELFFLNPGTLVFILVTVIIVLSDLLFIPYISSSSLTYSSFDVWIFLMWESNLGSCFWKRRDSQPGLSSGYRRFPLPSPL